MYVLNYSEKEIAITVNRLFNVRKLFIKNAVLKTVQSTRCL